MAIPKNSVDFIIRRANKGDVEAIYFLVKNAFADYTHKGKNPVKKETIADIREDINKNTVLIIEITGEIVGSLRLELQGDCCYYLKRFSISPDFQQQGLGTKLYQQAESTARGYGARYIFLYSSVEDNRLINFYNKLGFLCLKRDSENGYERGLWIKNLEQVIK